MLINVTTSINPIDKVCFILLGIVVSMRQSLDTIVAEVPFVVEARQPNFVNVKRKQFVLVRSNAVHRYCFRCHLTQAFFVVGKSEALFHCLLHTLCSVLSANLPVIINVLECVQFRS